MHQVDTELNTYHLKTYTFISCISIFYIYNGTVQKFWKYQRIWDLKSARKADIFKATSWLCEISGSHGGECEVQSLWDILPCYQIDVAIDLRRRQYIPEDSELQPVDWFYELTLRLWTAATKEHIVHTPDDKNWRAKWNDTDRGNPKNSEKNLSQCHSIHYKSHMDWPGREPVPLTAKKIYFIYFVTFIMSLFFFTQGRAADTVQAY
jgi:hypothetical protein